MSYFSNKAYTYLSQSGCNNNIANHFLKLPLIVKLTEPFVIRHVL